MTKQELTLEYLVEKLDFRKVGIWELGSANISYKIFDDSFRNAKEVIYVFATEQKILYIGKTIYSGYESRFYRYIHIGKTKFINFRCNEKIKASINSGKSIDIYIHATEDYLYRNIININLTESLEVELVKILKQQDKIKNKSKPFNENNYCWNWTERQLKKLSKDHAKSPSKHSE